MKALLDTNILLDILIQERASHEISLLILRLAKGRHINLQVSTQSLTDTEYILSRNNQDFTIFADMVKWMLNHVDVDGPDAFHLQDALDGYSGDFEDDLQYAYAMNNACDVIITNDRKFIQRETPGDIKMMTPEEFVGRMRA